MSDDVYLDDEEVESGSDWEDWDVDLDESNCGSDWDPHRDPDIRQHTQPIALTCNLNRIQLAYANTNNNHNDQDKTKLYNSIVYKWTSTEVITFITSLNPEYAKYESKLSIAFAKQNVKGTSLFLIREHHL